MKTFEEFTRLNETIILEMPHILLGDKVVDLELEVHAKMKPNEFVQYIKDWIDGKPIPSKTPGFSMQINAGSVKEFSRKVLSQPFLKNFVLAHYGEDTWDEVEGILRSNL